MLFWHPHPCNRILMRLELCDLCPRVEWEQYDLIILSGNHHDFLRPQQLDLQNPLVSHKERPFLDELSPLILIKHDESILPHDVDVLLALLLEGKHVNNLRILHRKIKHPLCGHNPQEGVLLIPCHLLILLLHLLLRLKPNLPYITLTETLISQYE